MLTQHYSCYAAADTSHQSVFEQVTHIPANKRVPFADILYKSTFRKTDSATAMRNLDSLTVIAQSINDISLECAVYDMRADYFSVNRKLNKLSTGYYKKAVQFAKDNKLLFETGLYLHNLGKYYFIYKQYADACQSYLRSEEIFNQVGYDNIPAISIYQSEVANLYYLVGDYDNAKSYLEIALKYAPRGRDKINIINTIALIYRNYRQFPQALNGFNQALNLAIANKDTAWIGIARGNIGSVYFLQKQYDKARPYIETDYKTSIAYGEPVNGAIALLRLVKIDIDRKNTARAGMELNTVNKLLTGSNEDVLGLTADYYDLKSQLDEQLGRIQESIAYRKQFEAVKDSLAKRDNVAAVERVKLRWEMDKRVTQLNKLKNDEKVQLIEKNAIGAVLILLIIISILLYNRQRLKSKKDKELLLAEKRIVDEELKSAGTALQRFTENLRQKNVLIENFKIEIDRLSTRSAGNANAGNLEQLLQAHIMTDEHWGDFKKLFSKVYPGFFVNLSRNYPQLSATDTRLLALIKLGLNNTEMANMLGITVEGIKKAKQRLRKKIDIGIVGDLDADGA